MTNETTIDAPVAISPHYTLAQLPSPTPVDVLIDVFADRVRGWQLDIAEQLKSTPHAGFAVLAVVSSYFEMYAKHEAGYVGDGAVRSHFQAGVRAVLEPVIRPEGATLPQSLLDLLYTEIRCGMYHDAMTGPSVLLSSAPGIPPIRLDAGRVIVDPHQIVLAIQDHFSRYILRLRNPGEKALRDNFRRRFLGGAKGKITPDAEQ